MPYSLMDPQPAELAEGEIGLQLDDGTLVAVSVSMRRPANNSGLAFTANGRCLNPDGTTSTCACGDPVASSFTHSASAAEVAALTGAAIRREMLLALLGEPASTHEVDGVEAPLINWGADLLATVSLRNAAVLASATSDGTGAEALLGLS
jgi:hypothetical protein